MGHKRSEALGQGLSLEVTPYSGQPCTGVTVSAKGWNPGYVRVSGWRKGCVRAPSGGVDV